MPIAFRFERLSIRGFRGIQMLDVELPAKTPLHFIGANNAGKSTALDAMAFVLRGGGFHTYDVGDYDFFHHAGGSIEDLFQIELHFTASDEQHLPAVKGIEAPSPVHGIRVVGETNRKGQHSHKHELFGKDGNTIYFSTRTPLAKGVREAYKDHDINYTKRRARPDDITDHLPEVWLLRADNLEASPLQVENRTTTAAFAPLGRAVHDHALEIRLWRQKAFDARRH
jgi:hypothetical protein